MSGLFVGDGVPGIVGKQSGGWVEKKGSTCLTCICQDAKYTSKYILKPLDDDLESRILP